MTSNAGAFHEHHAELLDRLQFEIDRVTADPAGTDPGPLVALLVDELVPHARGEERELYPAVDRIMMGRPGSTRTMTIDHEAIEREVAAVAAAAAGARGRLPILLARLDAIVRLHFEKEERVYLPLLAETLDEAEQRRLLSSIEVEPARD